MSYKFGLLGEKLNYSYSPMIHNIIMKQVKINGKYKIYEVAKEKLKDFIYDSNNEFLGLNVTIPYKIDVMKYLDHLSTEAEAIGSINTIHFKDSKLFGYNTDYFGFDGTLKRNNIDVSGEKAIILGTGGASKAVVKCLKDNGARDILLVSRNKTGDDIINYNQLKELTGFKILINTTPVGVHPNVNASPIELDQLKKFDVALDLIYNPNETLFLKWAKELGLKYAGGLYMLVAQAVKSQEIWNGIKIDDHLIDDIYNEVKVNLR